MQSWTSREPLLSPSLNPVPVMYVVGFLKSGRNSTVKVQMMMMMMMIRRGDAESPDGVSDAV